MPNSKAMNTTLNATMIELKIARTKLDWLKICA